MPTLLTKKTDWILRKALPEDRDNLRAFFKKNLWQSKENSDGIFAWKYERNPLGKTLALIGENSQKDIIATSMFMPFTLSIKGIPAEAYQWVDLFVGLEYRGQLIADKTLQMGLDEARNSGAAICFAFPNQNSVPVHKKNNGYLLGNILRFTKPLDSEYLAKRFIKSVFLAKISSFFVNIVLNLASKETYLFNPKGYRLEEVKRCGQEFDLFWNKFVELNPDKILVKRDSAYLNWKYLGSPAKNRKIFALRKISRHSERSPQGEAKNLSEVIGFMVLECSGTIGYIVDILAIEKSALHLLVKSVINYFKKNKMDSVVFVGLENHPYIRELKSFGFLQRNEQKYFYIYLLSAIRNTQYVGQDLSALKDSNNWFITIGDCDIESL